VQVGRVPFNGEPLYTIAPFGVLSGVGGGVGMGVSLGKNRAGVLLILFGVGGVIGGLFSHPSGGVCTRGVCRGRGYGSSSEVTSISQSLREGMIGSREFLFLVLFADTFP
jgi:hypothetical protein